MARVRSRKGVYLTVRLLAGAAFLLAVTVLPSGLAPALVVVGAGAAAVAASIWSNAAGPGERAGARQQDRYFDSIAPPQGDWPPYEPGSRERGASEDD